MKTIGFWAIALFWMCSMSACKKDMMGYEGTEGVYFAVQHGAGAGYGSETSWPYQKYTDVEFVKVPEDEITVQIKVMITGPVKDYDRPFKVVINPDSTNAVEGTHYLPLPKEVIVPANEIQAFVPVTLLRTEELRTETKTIGLKLLENEHFSLSFPEWDAIPGYFASSTRVDSGFDASLHSIHVNDFMVQPAVWHGSIQAGNRESGSWGAFSRKKIELMFTLFNLKYEDFSSSATMPFVLSALIATEGAKYLVEQFTAGTPVLEDDGRLMWIGTVPWTSYVGVKWVP